jgi:hypothetical protein
MGYTEFLSLVRIEFTLLFVLQFKSAQFTLWVKVRGGSSEHMETRTIFVLSSMQMTILSRSEEADPARQKALLRRRW